VKALTYHGPGRHQWSDVAAPELRDPEDAIVRVDAVTICGTDLHILKGVLEAYDIFSQAADNARSRWCCSVPEPDPQRSCTNDRHRVMSGAGRSSSDEVTRVGRLRDVGPCFGRRHQRNVCLGTIRPHKPTRRSEMTRKKLDRVLATGGLVVAAVLVAAGALLTWAHVFVDHEVHSQLAAQKIYFPPKGSDALASPEIGRYLNKYAGQQLVTGPQAKAYADHFIAVHIKEIGGGQTYAQLSTKSLANPNDQKLAQTVQTVFRGETLRGLLLNAYAFSTMGYIAFIASIVAFVGAGLMALLSALGFVHARQVHDDGTPRGAPTQEMISA
jgi:hypothetical protein